MGHTLQENTSYRRICYTGGPFLFILSIYTLLYLSICVSAHTYTHFIGCTCIVLEDMSSWNTCLTRGHVLVFITCLTTIFYIQIKDWRGKFYLGCSEHHVFDIVA